MEKIGSTRPAIRLVLENFRRPRQSWTRAGGPDHGYVPVLRQAPCPVSLGAQESCAHSWGGAVRLWDGVPNGDPGPRPGSTNATLGPLHTGGVGRNPLASPFLLRAP
ncbi:unnamed protein product [Rangifer tarandus platyrhynchus]|uniref:Uncharacterized protein n=1 Tax=Rangifer tarandus platyrhynchus TaxID=3082113 RepID=A0AC59ZWV1_RANTA